MSIKHVKLKEHIVLLHFMNICLCLQLKGIFKHCMHGLNSNFEIHDVCVF